MLSKLCWGWLKNFLKKIAFKYADKLILLDIVSHMYVCVNNLESGMQRNSQ